MPVKLVEPWEWDSRRWLDFAGRELRLADDAIEVFRASGAYTPEAVYSVLQDFPSATGMVDLNSARLSNAALETGSELLLGLMASGGARGESHEPPDSSGGAWAPRDSEWQPGMTVPMPPVGSTGGAGAIASNSDPVIDHRRCTPWPVKDQGLQRQTCVAFAVAALRELRLCYDENAIIPLSEQLLYWAAKLHVGDPLPNQDGTFLQFGLQALTTVGICEEGSCAYSSASITGNPSHDKTLYAPSPGAIAAANARRIQTRYDSAANRVGRAALIKALLEDGPVAITLPLAQDPLTRSTNWDTDLARESGYVLDPPPNSVIRQGHAVCVTGFQPDDREPMGGYFVIRNSWGSQRFGAKLPHPGYAGPEPGYGQVSASYVETFLWEHGTL